MKQNWLLSLLWLLASMLGTARAGEAADVLYYTPNEKGFIMNWLVSLRHPFDYAYLGASLNYDGFADEGGEAKVNPVAGMNAAGGTPWYEGHFEVAGWAKGVIEFPPCPMHMTYTFVYLWSDTEQKDVVLLTGSDDALLVRLNGIVVQRVQMQRGYNADQDKVAGLTLHKGWNTVMCKIDDYAGGHGLAFRFVDTKGDPLRDLKICFNRPADGTEPHFIEGAAYEAEAARLLKDAIRLGTEANDFGKSEVACRKVVADFSKSAAAAQALFEAGACLEKTGHPAEAIRTYDELVAKYPHAKWCEDALLAKSQLLAKQKDAAGAGVALDELLMRFPSSNLVPEALLQRAALYIVALEPQKAERVCNDVRDRFPATVEAVKALEILGDIRHTGKAENEAKTLWRQVVEEAGNLSDGKYVWYVNVQVILKVISDRARLKIEGKFPQA